MASRAWAINAGQTISLGEAAVTAATDTLTITGHSLTEGDLVAFDTLDGGADGPLEEGVVYYVRNVDGDDLQVSGARGSNPVTFDADGTAEAYTAVPSYTAEELRQIASHNLGHGSPRRLGAREGVRPGGGPVVSVAGTTWTIHDHTGVIEPGESTTQGPYTYVMLATSGELAPADGSNPRLDALDIALTDDDVDGSGGREVEPVYTVGTPGSNPTPPTLLPGRLRVGTILVPHDAGAATAARARWAVASGGVLPVDTMADLPTDGLYPGLTAWVGDLDMRLTWRPGSGWMPDPGTVMCRLFMTNAQSIPQNTDTPVNFNSADIDPLSGWSVGQPSRYVLPFAGTYRVEGGVSMQGGAAITQLQCWSRLNGSTNLRGSHVGIGTGGVTEPSAPARATLRSVGDGGVHYVELMARHNGSGSVSTATTAARSSTLIVTYAGPPA